jgi:hypothetical protein
MYFATNSTSSLTPLETKASFSKDVILLSLSTSRRVLKGRIKGILLSDDFEQSTWYVPVLHSHSTGHIIATVAGCITNQNQNMTAGVANINDTNTSTSLDGMVGCCNLNRERNRK